MEKIRVQPQGDMTTPCPVVSLEDFFAENQDPASIGCNLSDHPGLDRFYELLLEIRDHPQVQDVLVSISEAQENDISWPFSDRVYVLTSLEPDELREWAAELQPDEVDEGFVVGQPTAAPPLQPGMRVLSLWWD